MKTLTAFAFAATSITAAACGTDDKPCDPNVPNTICTIAGHSEDRGYTGDNGPATSADFDIPMDTATAPDGRLWIIDFNNYVVRRIDTDGTIHTVVGNHQLGDSPASEGVPTIEALNAANNHTPTMTFADNYVYFASWHESRVKRVSMTDMMMEIVGGRGTRTYYDGDGGPFKMAAVDLPSSITFNADGEMVLMDQGNLVVRAVDSTGNIRTIVGKCIIEAVQCGGAVVPVQCANSDKLVCGDLSQCDSAGGKSTAQCTQVSAGDGGLATEARLNVPYTQFADPAARIAYDHNGDLIIPETGGDRIRKVDHTTGIISTIAGTGSPGYSGDGGPATSAQIHHPVDVAIADDNSIYFTDVYNHCVRKIDPSGTITAVAGACHSSSEGEGGSFAGDGGSPLEAQLNKPYGVSLSGNKLYVADSYNNRVRVVNLP